MNAPQNLLVVDDDPGSLALVVRILTGEGYQVRAADSGELALASLAHSRPELIILDVHLGGIDGFEVSRRLHADPETQDIPVVLVSAFTDPDDWKTGLEAGASDFLAKPFTDMELITRVKTHLRLVRSTRDLQEKEQQYRNLADSGLALIWRSGTDKKCFYFNGPWLRFTGRTLDQERGDGWTEGVHPEDFDGCLNTYVRAFDKREPFEMRYRIRHHSGEYRWILDMGTPNFDSRGEFLGYIGHCFDITEKMHYEEALVRNTRLDSLGLLAGGIAHDFNNLLAGLFAYLSLARSEVEGLPAAARHLDKALGAFGRAKDLTRQLLTFSKGGDPVRKTGDLAPKVREWVDFALSGSQVVCEFHIEGGLWPCEFDDNQIGQVMDNLVINALQAMPDGGKITVGARNVHLREGQKPGLPGGAYVQVSVTDQGPGIGAEVLPKIFEPFFTTKAHGTGLGLPTCHSILQKHQGALDVDSKVGVGTTFHFLLPAAPHQGASAQACPPDSPHRGSGPFLVLEDEDMLRELNAGCLESLGYTVTAVRDGDGALAVLADWVGRGTVPRAALLDLTVPGGKGGKEVVRELLQAFPTLKAFATSGYSEDPVMARPQEFGFTESLHKPFLQKELESMLNRYLPPTS